MTSGELRRRRKALRLSQTALSVLLGVRQSTISDWETGLVSIAHPRVLDLALQKLEFDHQQPAAR